MKLKASHCISATLLLGCVFCVFFLTRNRQPQPVKAQTIRFETATSPQTRIIRKRPDPAQIMELPEAERVLISGQGALDSASYFNCWITNRSSWTVTELWFRIAAGQSDASTRWERIYSERVHLPPSTASRISFKVTDGRDAETRWNITGARGTPPR